MAEVVLTPQAISRTGLEPTYLDSTSSPALSTGSFPSTGDQMVVTNDGKTWLHVKNGATDVTVTVLTPITRDGLALADRAVTVPANEDRVIGPFPKSVYGDPFKFALDSVANVEIAVLRLP